MRLPAKQHTLDRFQQAATLPADTPLAPLGAGCGAVCNGGLSLFEGCANKNRLKSTESINDGEALECGGSSRRFPSFSIRFLPTEKLGKRREDPPHSKASAISCHSISIRTCFSLILGASSHWRLAR